MTVGRCAAGSGCILKANLQAVWIAASPRNRAPDAREADKDYLPKLAFTVHKKVGRLELASGLVKKGFDQRGDGLKFILVAQVLNRGPPDKVSYPVLQVFSTSVCNVAL